MSNKIKITETVAQEILHEDSDLYEIVENGDWVSDGKYDIKDIVVKEIATGFHYSGYWYRSGSYYTDYDYQYPTELVRVEKREKITYEWVAVGLE